MFVRQPQVLKAKTSRWHPFPTLPRRRVFLHFNGPSRKQITYGTRPGNMIIGLIDISQSQRIGPKGLGLRNNT
ncbi:Uncharacterized protein HZ326_13606 [Fusarium oxysporum f. sp. albedinis]|nr:Uncharacterized protein HZ326_13606 [Fusarium oxysporum f. sp. albedinis]